MKQFFKKLLAIWIKVTRPIGIVVSFVFIFVVYFICLPIFSLIRFKDPLGTKLGAESYWRDRVNFPHSLERCRLRY